MPFRTRLLSICAAVSLLTIQGATQERATPAPSNDPRVGLKAGFRDAGVAARNMELVATLPKPEGFFDPRSPAGAPTEPEAPPTGSPTPAAPTPEPSNTTAALPTGAGFTNSDVAFRGNHAIVGNYHGFNTYDIENARKPRLLASIVCPGGQGDVSVHGNLLFMSVQEVRGRIDCGTQGVQAAVSPERFRGVRIFDISNLRRPKQVAAVQTCRGSHTHTLVVDPDDKANIYVYGSGTSSVRPGEELAGCSAKDPKEDPNTALFSIDVIKVPLSAPEKAAIVNRPRIFADPATGNIAGLWPGGTHGPGTQTTRVTSQCHDITVFPEIGLAAGACSGNGILLDISDPVNPIRLDHVADKNFAFWHSATFNNDGSKVVFTDEWGGGTRPRCRVSDPPTWGANAIFDIVDRKMQFRGYYKMPAAQTESENCVAHNGSLIPVPGRDLMVQAWYQGGISLFDFTDSANAVEIAFFDRGPIDSKQLYTGGHWSAYWYNGFIYGAEIARGVDVLRLLPSEHLTQNELDAALQVRMTEFNSQQQPRITWPATFQVARAYVDQLARSKALEAARLTELRTAIDQADRRDPSRADLDRLNTLVAQLEKDAGAATGRDATRMKSLAETIKARVTRLR